MCVKFFSKNKILNFPEYPRVEVSSRFFFVQKGYLMSVKLSLKGWISVVIWFIEHLLYQAVMKDKRKEYTAILFAVDADIGADKGVTEGMVVDGVGRAPEGEAAHIFASDSLIAPLLHWKSDDTGVSVGSAGARGGVEQSLQSLDVQICPTRVSPLQKTVTNPSSLPGETGWEVKQVPFPGTQYVA